MQKLPVRWIIWIYKESYMSRNVYPTKSCPNFAATSHVTYSRTLAEIDWFKHRTIRLVQFI